MNISDTFMFEKLAKRFCKDTNIPIKLFHRDYFESRLELFENQFKAKTLWEQFISDLEGNFNSIEEYLEFCNEVNYNAINYITSTPEYQEFNMMDMNKYGVKYDIPKRDIFHPNNAGEEFISVDLAKANFTALHFYNPAIVGNCETYEEFINKFNKGIKHLTKSKHIRQVIFGNCNPKRQTTYEKYIMSLIFKDVILKYFITEDIACFTDDEIVIKLNSSLTDNLINDFYTELKNYCSDKKINIHCDRFKLIKIDNTSSYIKKFTGLDKSDGVELKCVSGSMMPFILRALNNQELQEVDLVFDYEGSLAKYIDIPNIKISI